MNVIWKHLRHGAEKHRPTGIAVHSMGERIRTPHGVLDAVDFLDSIGLSAHALVCPDGTVVRCRDDDQVAWHAKGFNTGWLGIEYLVPGVHTYPSFLEAIREPYVTEEAWEAGLEMVRTWMDRWSIDKLKRHSDLDPQRKKDPGDGFAWQEFIRSARPRSI